MDSIERSNPSIVPMQGISQMQLAGKAWAKYYKKSFIGGRASPPISNWSRFWAEGKQTFLVESQMTQLLRLRNENQRNEAFSRDEMDWMQQLRWDDGHHRHRHHHHRRPISKLPAIVTKLPKKVRRRLAAPVAWVVSEAVHAFSLLMYRPRQCPENPRDSWLATA